MSFKRFAPCLAAVFFACALPSGAGATWPGKPGRIVYDALAPTGDGYYSIRPDGLGNRRILSVANGGAGEAAWSRDATQLAYMPNTHELWEAETDGSEARRILLLEDAYADSPAWSPSGRWLVFTLLREFEDPDDNVITTDYVYIVRPDGTGLRRLTSGHDPTWSSRNRIAYADDSGDVITMRPDGRGRRIWVAQRRAVYVSDLDFSPDGAKLMYRQGFGTNSTIRTIDLRTGARTRLSAFNKRVRTSDVSWAPGGRRVAYLHHVFPEGGGPSPPSELRTISPLGKRVKTLFTFPAHATVFSFAWQTLPR
jgi:Tol biopolymer transport system component